MPYQINKFNGDQLVVLQDGTLDSTTSIGLVGRNFAGFGEIQNENFLFLLENFAGKLGNNRGKDSGGNDVDGLTWDNRSLISLVGQF